MIARMQVDCKVNKRENERYVLIKFDPNTEITEELI